jgi:XTP/dITP diphosphohydrolase
MKSNNMTKLVFATNNQHKLEEVQAILSERIPIFSLRDIDCREDISETAPTLEGNALLKARFVKENYGCNCFADDTGLEVAALNNAPGVYSARYAGEPHNAEANVKKLLAEMQGKENRSARFRTAIALILDEKEQLFEGIIDGCILTEPKGSAGFGYDPLFVPNGYTQTFAELGNDIKNAISHRALAIRKLVTFLSAL